MKKQFGFRHSHSTEKIKQACDSGQYACGVFLDLQKAFDTVYFSENWTIMVLDVEEIITDFVLTCKIECQ